MLNENKERELCYVVYVEEIRPLEGYDRVEYARIGAGWWVVVRKGQFKVDDLAIYFEIDSKVPEKEPFMFLESKKFRVRTQKMCKVVSQGLLMSAEDFGWKFIKNAIRDGEGSVTDTYRYIEDEYGNTITVGTFLTKKLGVTYYSPEDEQRKAPSIDKYQKMVMRHKKLFKNKFIAWLYSKNFGKKLLFKFLGKKKDKKTDWPSWVVKTDEERCQNCPWLFPGNDEEWVATEKVDGTSTTFTVRGFGKKRQFLVCSRNVVYDTPEKNDKNFYKDSDGNVYLEMANKYNVEKVIGEYLDKLKLEEPDTEFVTVQAETFGGNIQKRDYSTNKHDLRVFNIIIGFNNGVETVRLNPVAGTEVAEKELHMPFVPIVDAKFKIPETCEELLSLAGGKSVIDGGMREGLVFRSKDGKRSFKAVDNEFLLKYHSN